jgi:CBS domain-containing protein
MGEQAVRKISDAKDRLHFMKHLLADVKALDLMIANKVFESGVARIGAEQEFCLVSRNWEPADGAADLLEELDDAHFTTELAKYNLEINLDPLLLEKDNFRKMENSLRRRLENAERIAATRDIAIVLTGILPTITPRHIELDQMTPSVRFEALDEAMRSKKGGEFELHITGVDELIAKHDSIVFEACNTSFQLHLQIDPDDAVDLYNWSQMIAAPVLAVSANSPLLLGKELWSETRIALFQQSIDVRNSNTLIREQQPRVTFGSSWLKERVTEIFKEDVARYDLMLTGDLGEKTALEVLDEGELPKLKALSLHNGTIYRWNRLCFGTGSNPHLRIECRYVPSGPTVMDEMANMVFWVGLMRAMREEHRQLWKKLPFRQVKANFTRAAISGMETKLNWLGKIYDTRELIELELLPLAEEGLVRSGVDRDDIRHYLGIIRQRLSSHNGSQWMIDAHRAMDTDTHRDIALRRMTALMHRNQSSSLPVGEWPRAHEDQLTGNELKLKKMYQIMITDLLTVSPDDPIDLLRDLSDWENITHFPVEDSTGKFVGLIAHTDLEQAKDGGHPVGEYMKTDLLTADPNDDIIPVITEMNEKGYSCVPIVYKNNLVGLVTKYDLEALDIRS